jgi:predicted metal-binding protein
MERAYEEVIDFIACGTTPGKIIAFRPSEASKARVSELIYKSKNASISSEEKDELSHYMQLEHLMRLAKARAQRYVVQ